jgi:hypothetical protein
MARRLILAVVAVAAAFVVLVPASASAATAPTAAPTLTSAPYALPVMLHWTPGNDLLNTQQSVFRPPGVCTTPATPGSLTRVYGNNTQTDFTGGATDPPDGTYCYYIQAEDALGGTANSPGLTVVVDTHNPTATVAVSAQAPGGIVSGTVGISGTSADAVSGVASTVLHAGAVGACSAGPVVGSSWDTTTSANGPYDVCNVVTDNAGHVAIAAVTVTVANTLPLVAAPAASSSAAPVVAVAGGDKADTLAPEAPTRLSVVLPRAKVAAGKVRVTLRWVKPAAADLDRVVVVLNRKRAPRGPADGSVVYRGLGASVALHLRAGQTGYLALFAYDHSGNMSEPARKVVSLASLIPLRPLTGSVLNAAPRLSWRAKKGTTYYNVQLFRNGRRVLVGWPSHASYVVPAGALLPGTYVWFVWPAVKRGDSATFGDLIGRATFVVKA